MGLMRRRLVAVHALSCLALAGSALTTSAATPASDWLAVVVPAHAGDLWRAVSALAKWPKNCSPVIQENVDLVLYYAEGEEDAGPTAALEAVASSAGRCFASTKLVYANLREEEDVYPRGPSVQFYKMFLDEGVKAQLAGYDAFAIIEWDVLVASDRSFERLYDAAFKNSEEFWVKGSNIEGTNFHEVAKSSETWHVMGHINGNAIYNNNDPMFAEFVAYALARWEYRYPYDVALWATISDFPYSWPLWQHYSSKFVTTNLISNVGYEHVDRKTVSDAVAGHTLFIHGSSVDGGNLAILRASTTPPEDTSDELQCEAACGHDGGDGGILPAGASTFCDPTCTAFGSRFGGYLCGAGDSARFGAACRMCYADVEEARKAERMLSDADGLHVVMCDTQRPPAASECSDRCRLNKDTVCDEACGTGVHGDYNCNWRGLGPKCRSCFDEVEVALGADEVAKRHGGRVIMCDTHEPPVAPVYFTEEAVPVTAASRRLTGGEDPPRKKKQKRQGRSDKAPHWKAAQKWTSDTCLKGCERMSKDGRRGRVCDSSCETGDPHGRLGCSSKKGQYGRLCRTCYNNVELAMAVDRVDHRAIMWEAYIGPNNDVQCDTVLPVTTYENKRQLLPFPEVQLELEFEQTSERQQQQQQQQQQQRSRKQKGEAEDAADDLQSHLCRSSYDHFTKDVKRGEICAFVEGGADRLLQTAVTVQSILGFMPGVRVAVATEPASVAAYESMVGLHFGVTVSSTPDTRLSGLFADQRCGEGTKLILYMRAGSVLSRAFTSKDTHTPRGELLVVHGDARQSYLDSEIARETASVLGFQTPSFTHGTDLMLPVGANAELRAELSAGDDEDAALSDEFGGLASSIPQLLAAVAYSRDTEGVRFVDPQAWVSENLFKRTSVWDIPLLKPRYACAIPSPTVVSEEDALRAEILERNLDFFRMGGACDNGLVAVDSS